MVQGGYKEKGHRFLKGNLISFNLNFHFVFQCLHESCSKMFTTLYNLRQHLKTVHEKAEQFVCTVNNCNAAFHNQRSLDLHKATHGNLEPPYRYIVISTTKLFTI